MIETKRLILEEWTDEDLPALKIFLQDIRVMWAYEHAFSDEEAETWLKNNQKSYREHGYGLWKMTLKETGEIIGECGITQQIVNGIIYPEIGYHLIFSQWHHGYAIEAAEACKKWGFDVLRTPTLATIVRDTNIASMNVAIRNGFIIQERFVKHYRGFDMPHYLFIKKNPVD